MTIYRVTRYHNEIPHQEKPTLLVTQIIDVYENPDPMAYLGAAKVFEKVVGHSAVPVRVQTPSGIQEHTQPFTFPIDGVNTVQEAFDKFSEAAMAFIHLVQQQAKRQDLAAGARVQLPPPR